jgi:hypothetical protein
MDALDVVYGSMSIGIRDFRKRIAEAQTETALRSVALELVGFVECGLGAALSLVSFDASHKNQQGRTNNVTHV